MLSSRMRTARPLTVVPVCMLGGGVIWGGGVVRGGDVVQGGRRCCPEGGGRCCPWKGWGREVLSGGSCCPLFPRPCDLSHDAFGVTPPPSSWTE